MIDLAKARKEYKSEYKVAKNIHEKNNAAKKYRLRIRDIKKQTKMIPL